MADVQPLRALHYDLRVAGPLQNLIAPPYDVIDPDQRAELAGRSPFNVVEVDLPGGDDPYITAADTMLNWQLEGVVVRDREPAIWALEQTYRGPDGNERSRRGFFARVRVEDYGPGRIRPHERTHPGPKEDRLNLTRATRANLSPIFSLFSDPGGEAWGALEPFTEQEPWGEATDDDGTENKLWRIADEEALAGVQAALADRELLIADGHHRYETARVYAEEIGGEGEHNFVLMCLVALEDPGLLVFPTHRLVSGLRDDSDRQVALRDAIQANFDVEPLETIEQLPPPAGTGPLELGYMDSHHKAPYRLRLKDQAIADAALEGKPQPYRELDTAVLEALLLKGALGLTDDDISHLHGLGYSRTDAEALALLQTGTYDAGFFVRATPIEQVRAIAASGENMPPKSTFFYPKVPTGLLFNPLD
jgi:uncharacterized protein (DUF1015 family)